MSTGSTETLLPTIHSHPYNPISTEEQVNIYNWCRFGVGHLLIRARAGCGKTTTLVELCKLLKPNSQSTFLAFNVHIKDELKNRLDNGVFCYTTHGLGYNAIMRKYKDATLDEYKYDKIIKKQMKTWNLAEVPNVLLYADNMKEMTKQVRASLTLNKKYVPDLCEKHGVKFDSQDIDRVFKILEEGLNNKKSFDFTDMIYLPYVDNKLWFFPQDFVLIDEAQDLNRAQHEMIKKIAKKDKAGNYISRLIFVGDDKQAIYGFAGADSYSFENLMRMKNMTVLPLTITFRCAKNIVKEANTIVPDIRAMDNAPDGIVRIGSALDEAMPGDFILSRKTFPLVKMFFELLVQGKKAHIKGSDIGESLISFTAGKNTMGQLDASLTNRLNELRDSLMSHGIINFMEDTNYSALRDKVKIMRFLMTMVKDVDELSKRINYIFRDTKDKSLNDGIILSTVHKAKGLEADRVFIIMPKDMPLRGSQPWQYIQEMNLKYIAITRAKNELVWDNVWTVDDGTFDTPSMLSNDSQTQ